MHRYSSTRRRAYLTVSLLSAVAVGALTSAASAQTTTGATSVAEVTVTARHRLESVQSVPIAISVVNGDEASAKNLNDIQDISAQVPSIDFRTSASNKDQTVFVRGIGTISTSPGVEPSVSTVIDGVVIARAGAATLDLINLDHIEVLDGPQGTLFGKNASAGVINIVTKNPTSTPGGYIDVSGFSGGEYHLNGALSGPIVDGKLNGVISAFDSHFDGNVTNVYLGEKVNGYDNKGARSKLVATPSSDLTVTVGADYTHSFETIPTGVFTTTNRVAYPSGAVTNYPAFAALLASEGVTPSSNNTTISSDDKSTAEDRNAGISGQIDWQFAGGYTLTSITAYRTWNNVQHQDYDQTSQASYAYPQVADIGHLQFAQTSEELRIASPKGGFIDYVAGLYYLDAVDHEIYERDVFQPNLATAPFTAGSGANNGIGHYGATDDNYAAFGEANVNFTKALRGMIGARVVDDQLSFYNARVTTVPPAGTAITGVAGSFSTSGSESKTGYSGRAGLQYDISGDVMAYATYSRGYKGPAYNVYFNQGATATAPLTPETSNAYDLGVKGQFLDHKLQADLSLFREDFNNYQANSSILLNGSIVTNLVNAGQVRTQGAEADFTARPVHGLSLVANLLYDDAKVVNFPCPAGSPITCNINNGQLPFAPKEKAHLEADYRLPITGAAHIDVETDYNWQSSTQYQLAQTAQTTQGAYGIWNASIAATSEQNVTVRILVKNILDQHYSSYLSNGTEGGTGVVRWVPRDNRRYAGIEVRKDF
jgi:iron complex outermembrane receptor protein